MITVKKLNFEKVIKETDLEKYIEDGFKEVKDVAKTAAPAPTPEAVTTATPATAPDPVTTPSFEGMTVPELKEIAKGLGIEGYSSLNKPELLKVISDHNGTINKQ